MEIKEQIKLKFLGVDFPSVQLTATKQVDENSDLSVKIDPKAFLPKDQPNQFRIVMNVELSTKDCFILKVVAVGYFELSQETDDETKRGFMNENSTAIMFPYVRAFISTLTANVGDVMSPILLPTRFFKGKMEEMPDDRDIESKKSTDEPLSK